MTWILIQKMHVQKVSYRTANFDAMEAFYTDTFGLPVVERATDRFAVEVGDTVVEFTRTDDDTDPFYHFTWDVPENRFDEAKAWLDERTELLESPSGDHEVYFEALDFHSVYFLDPAGNLGEFAARHSLDTASDRSFDATEFVRVSEVGVPVEDVVDAVETLEAETVISPHPAAEEINPEICPVGNDAGMFPMMKVGKEWFMTDKPAEVHPITVELRGDTADRYEFDDYPYTLVWNAA